MPSTASKPDSKSNGTVQSLTRALGLLSTLAKTPHGLPLKDIAAQTQLPPSTAHRLLTTLAGSGFVQGQGPNWTVGLQAFCVGQAFLADRDLIDIARQPMAQLMEETQETVKLGLLSGTHAVVLSQAESSQSMRAFAQPGEFLPLYCTSLGKALLGAEGQDAARALLEQVDMAAQTARTLTDFTNLWSDIQATFAHGYAIQDEEFLLGLRGAAACVYDEAGKAVGAISVTGPSVRIPGQRLDQLGPLVAQVAAEVTEAYGGKVPYKVAA